MFTKRQLFRFAEFFHCYYSSGLMVEELYKFYRNKRPARNVPLLEAILNDTAKLFNVAVSDVNSKSRKRELVTARQMTSYIAKKRGFTEREIAEKFGWDRAAVYFYIKRARGLAETLGPYRDQLNGLLTRFGREGVKSPYLKSI